MNSDGDGDDGTSIQESGRQKTEAAKQTVTPGRELGARTASLGCQNLAWSLTGGDCIGWPIRRPNIDTYES